MFESSSSADDRSSLRREMLTPRALDVPTSPKTMTPGSAHTKSSPNLSFFQFAAVSGSDQLPADARGEASMLSRRLVWGSTRLERDPALRYRGYGKTPLIPRVILRGAQPRAPRGGRQIQRQARLDGGAL